MEQPVVPTHPDERAEQETSKLDQFSEAGLAKLTEARRRAKAELVHQELVELRRKRAAQR
jgi:hypothetical protein